MVGSVLETQYRKNSMGRNVTLLVLGKWGEGCGLQSSDTEQESEGGRRESGNKPSSPTKG